MKIDMSIYSAMEKVLHIQRLLIEKLGRVPTLDELSKSVVSTPLKLTKFSVQQMVLDVPEHFCITFLITAY